MDIHKSMDNWRLISIKTWISIYGYLLFTDIYCGMFLHGYPCLDINVDIYACLDNWKHVKKSWISMLISVDFWKSMHGFAILGPGYFFEVVFHKTRILKHSKIVVNSIFKQRKEFNKAVRYFWKSMETKKKEKEKNSWHEHEILWNMWDVVCGEKYN